MSRSDLHHGKFARASSHREAAAADAAGRPGCSGKGVVGELRKASEKQHCGFGQHRNLATMISRREAAAADAAGRPGCNGLRKKAAWTAQEACDYEQP